MTPSLFRSAGLVTLVVLVNGLLAFAANIAITRILGPSGRGKVTFVITWAGLLAWIVSAGMGPTLTKAKARGDQTVADLYGACFGVSALTGALMTVAWAGAFLTLRGSVLGGVSVTDACWVAFLVPVLVATNNLGHVASLEGRVLAFNAWLSAGAASFVVATAALAIADRLTTSTAIAVWTVAATIPLVLFRSGQRGVIRSKFSQVKALITQSLRSSLASVAMFGMWRIDVVFVKAFRGYEELGLYAVAVSVAEIILAIAFSVRATLQVRQGQTERREALPELLARVTRLTALGCTMAALAMAVLGRPAIRIVYGGSLVPAVPALLLLLPGMIALALHGPLFDYLYSEGRANGVIVAMAFSLLLNIALNIVLLRSHSFAAAAFASTVAYAAVFGACAVQFCRTTGCALTALLLPRVDDVRSLWRRRSATEDVSIVVEDR